MSPPEQALSLAERATASWGAWALSGILIFIVVGWLVKFMAEGFAAKEFARHLETHKAELRTAGEQALHRLQTEHDHQRARFAVGEGVVREITIAMHPDRVRAVQTLWADYRRAMSETSLSLAILEMDGPDAARVLRGSMSFAGYVESPQQMVDRQGRILPPSPGAEAARFLAGEELYFLTTLARGILSRANTVAQDREPGLWFEREDIRMSIAALLGNEQLAELDAQPRFHLMWLNHKADSLILEKAAGVVSGEVSAREAFERAKAFSEAAAEADRQMAPSVVTKSEGQP